MPFRLPQLGNGPLLGIGICASVVLEADSELADWIDEINERDWIYLSYNGESGRIMIRCGVGWVKKRRDRAHLHVDFRHEHLFRNARHEADGPEEMLAIVERFVEHDARIILISEFMVPRGDIPPFGMFSPFIGLQVTGAGHSVRMSAATLEIDDEDSEVESVQWSWNRGEDEDVNVLIRSRYHDRVDCELFSRAIEAAWRAYEITTGNDEGDDDDE